MQTRLRGPRQALPVVVRMAATVPSSITYRQAGSRLERTVRSTASSHEARGGEEISGQERIVERDRSYAALGECGQERTVRGLAARAQELAAGQRLRERVHEQ